MKPGTLAFVSRGDYLLKLEPSATWTGVQESWGWVYNMNLCLVLAFTDKWQTITAQYVLVAMRQGKSVNVGWFPAARLRSADDMSMEKER